MDQLVPACQPSRLPEVHAAAEDCHSSEPERLSLLWRLRNTFLEFQSDDDPEEPIQVARYRRRRSLSADTYFLKEAGLLSTDWTPKSLTLGDTASGGELDEALDGSSLSGRTRGPLGFNRLRLGSGSFLHGSSSSSSSSSNIVGNLVPNTDASNVMGDAATRAVGALQPVVESSSSSTGASKCGSPAPKGQSLIAPESSSSSGVSPRTKPRSSARSAVDIEPPGGRDEDGNDVPARRADPQGSREMTRSPEDFAEAREAFGRDTEQRTVMIRHIACRYTEKDVRQILDAGGFQGSYDWIYLPGKRKKYSNLGYTFVRFRQIEDVARAKDVFDGKPFGSSLTQKRCEITLAHKQQLGKGFFDRRRRQSIGS